MSFTSVWHRHPGVRSGDQLSVGERAADRLRNGMGSWAFVFGALGLWIGITPTLPDWAAYVMPVLVVALCATIVNRVRKGLAEKA